LRLSFRPPFDWELLTQFLALRATPGVEEVAGPVYRRTVGFGERSGVIEIQPEPQGRWLELSVPAVLSPDLVAIIDRVRRLLDLSADPEPIDRHLARDPLLRNRIRRRPGARVPGAWSGFEAAARAIVAQQVSVKGATTIMGRIAERFGRPLPAPVGALSHLFPEPAAIASGSLSGLGLTGARAGALGRLAEEVNAGRLSLDDLSTDLDTFLARLVELPGIGEWTAQVIAMRARGEPDAFPAGDIGIHRALDAGMTTASAKRVLARAERWRPWRAYAVVYLWTLDV
jgi:AraC family transcriptional regulator of adaptative response / DNA-3-methyladenine glycosylase II